MAGSSYYKGLSVNGNYLYQHYYSTAGAGFWGIARTNITSKTRDDAWKNITESTLETVSDLCGDTTYLYLLGETKVIVMDYSGTFIKDISLSAVYSNIYSDGTYLYISSSSAVKVYTIAGVAGITITVANIQSVAVNNGDIYIVTTTKCKKYNSSGVFQSEFDITGTITDAVII